MSSHISLDPPTNQLSETAQNSLEKISSRVEEGVQQTKGYARQAVDATKDAAHRATDSVKEIYHTAAVKAEDALTTSKDYARRHPVTFVLGSIAIGAAIGYLIMNARKKPTFRERFAEEPLGSVREAIFSALAPVTQRVHDGYDSARDGVGKVMDQVHRLRPGRSVDTLSDRIGRAANNLKFW